MPTAQPTPPVCTLDHLTRTNRTNRTNRTKRQRPLEEGLRSLHAPGWEQRLQPLAAHMAQMRLVRARAENGPPLRHLDLEVLRVALVRLLQRDEAAGAGDGQLIYALAVAGAAPSLVAAQGRSGESALAEQLRSAIAQLALAYEDVAFSASASVSASASASAAAGGA